MRLAIAAILALGVGIVWGFALTRDDYTICVESTPQRTIRDLDGRDSFLVSSLVDWAS